MKDTRDLSAEQMGAYVFLLDEQWKKGALPADIEALGSIAKLSVPKMRKAMQRYGDRLRPHPDRPGMIYNAFMERVREQQYAKYLRRSGAGKKGAEARHAVGNATGNASSNAISNASGNATTDIENIDHYLAALDSDAGARAQKSPALELCFWLCDESLKAGVISPHHEGDRFAWCYPQLDDAEKLLEYYDADDIRTRAGRLIAASAQRRILRPVCCKTLLEVWDWGEINGKFALAGGARAGRRATLHTDEQLEGL